MKDVVIPELPPGYETHEQDERRLRIMARDESGGIECVALFFTQEQKVTLYMGAPGAVDWASRTVYGNAQEAVDAGVAKLWMGVFE